MTGRMRDLVRISETDSRLQTMGMRVMLLPPAYVETARLPPIPSIPLIDKSATFRHQLSEDTGPEVVDLTDDSDSRDSPYFFEEKAVRQKVLSIKQIGQSDIIKLTLKDWETNRTDSYEITPIVEKTSPKNEVKNELKSAIEESQDTKTEESVEESQKWQRETVIKSGVHHRVAQRSNSGDFYWAGLHLAPPCCGEPRPDRVEQPAEQIIQVKVAEKAIPAIPEKKVTSLPAFDMPAPNLSGSRVAGHSLPSRAPFSHVQSINRGHVPPPSRPGQTVNPLVLTLSHVNGVISRVGHVNGAVSRLGRAGQPIKKRRKSRPYSAANKKKRCTWVGCSYSTNYTRDLARHIRCIHTGERPYLCDYPGCGRDFNRPDYLNIHRRKHAEADDSFKLEQPKKARPNPAP